MCRGFGPNKDYRSRLLATLMNIFKSYNKYDDITYL